MELIPKFHSSVPFYILMTILVVGIVWAVFAIKTQERRLLKRLVQDIVAFDKNDSLSKEEIKLKLEEKHFCPRFEELTLSSILLELVREGKIHSSMMCVILGQNRHEYPVYSQIKQELPSPSSFGEDNFGLLR